MEKEKRFIGGVETRADGAAPQIVGYAALFDVEAVIGDFFRERIARGAFAEAIGRDDVRALFNHDPNYVLGRSAAKTLRMSEDSKGLKVEIDPETTVSWVKDLMASMKRGDINQMSFAFSAEAQSWAEESEKLPLRTLERVSLYDVAVVTYPAFPTTTAAVRSLADYRAAHRHSRSGVIRTRMKIDFGLRLRVN